MRWFLTHLPCEIFRPILWQFFINRCFDRRVFDFTVLSFSLLISQDLWWFPNFPSNSTFFAPFGKFAKTLRPQGNQVKFGNPRKPKGERFLWETILYPVLVLRGIALFLWGCQTPARHWIKIVHSCVQNVYPILGLGSEARLLWHFQTPVLHWINFDLRFWSVLLRFSPCFQAQKRLWKRMFGGHKILVCKIWFYPKRAQHEEKLYKIVENPHNWHFLGRGGGGKRNFMDRTILWTPGRFWITLSG